MSDKDLDRKYSDTTGTAVGVVPEHINRAALVMVETLRRELGSGPWSDGDIRRVADQVWGRAGSQVDLVNEQAQRRLWEQTERERLAQLPEWDRVIVLHRPDLAKELSKMPKAQRVALAREIEADRASPVVRVGRFSEWVDPASLGPHALSLRAKATQAALEAAEKEA